MPAILPGVSLAVSPFSDLDGNGIVSSSRIALQGTTLPGVRLRLDIGGDGTFELRGRSNREGNFKFLVPVNIGETNFRVEAADVSGTVQSAALNVVRGDAIIAWNRTALNAIRQDGTPPPKAARNLAMVHVAMYDAVNSIDGTGESYLVGINAPAGSSRIAASSAAALRVLSALYPSQTGVFQLTLAEAIAEIPARTFRTTSIRLGQIIGDAVLNSRRNDGSNVVVNYVPGTDPGNWTPTPPAMAAALLPQWPDVNPFALNSPSQFRPAAPPALTSAQYATELNEVKAIGKSDSATRTQDQTDVALFWGDGGGTFTPPGHWNQIAQNASLARKLAISDNARLFALLNIAEADAGIACWDVKYAYNLWRPITAIRNADIDGNAATTVDPTWSPLIATPPFPAYSSGHSTFSGAAEVVLTSYFGATPFVDKGDPTKSFAPRSFQSFAAAADEAGVSRIYGGIHFASDNVLGLDVGRKIGAFILAGFLRPR